MSTPIHPRDGEQHSVDADSTAADADSTAASAPGQHQDPAINGAAVGNVPTARVVSDDEHAGSMAPDRSRVIDRQRERFGGVKVGSAFFGWLTATGMAVLLVSLLAAAGLAFGAATDTTLDQATREAAKDAGTANTVGLVGGIVLLVVVLVSYYCGGYVAGRMARFNGLRQGLAVCLWGVVMALLLAAIAAIAGTQYGLFAGLNLPSLPIATGSEVATRAIAIGAALLAALVGALLGGLAGMRFHRKVDRTGLEPSSD